MIKEAIILAGGLGTRLRSVVADLPKCMAPVAGKPFLYYIIEHYKKQGIQKFIFSLGYMSEKIETYLSANYPLLNYQLSIEKAPLGTGGAIKLACDKATGQNVLVLNGDTLFSIDIEKLSSFHEKNNADCTLSLKPMQSFNRYGVVEMNADNSVISFKEKQQYENGLINAGVYALNITNFLKEKFSAKFSFEQDYLEKHFNKKKIYGLMQDEYFIDIGIPEDLEKANKDLQNNSFEKKIDITQIDKTWTLFLDRDGVINDEKHQDYINTWDEFKFYDGVKEAIKIFAKKFKYIFIVTNQRGIAKGITQLTDLQLIHENMKGELEKEGGRIDAIYFCPEMESLNRKPNPGMGLQAKIDFPEIDFNKSIMIGNTISDMQFGRNIGAKTVFLPTTRLDVNLADERIDAIYSSLIDFAKALLL